MQNGRESIYELENTLIHWEISIPKSHKVIFEKLPMLPAKQANDKDRPRLAL
jgi:hypothetical protein